MTNDLNLKEKQKASTDRSSRAKRNDTKDRKGIHLKRTKGEASRRLSLAACKLKTKRDEHTPRNVLHTGRPAAPSAS